VKLVGEAVKHEHALSPNKPIYLVGDSFGGSLALAVAAHNPTVDLVLILSNPGDSINGVFFYVKFVNVFSWRCLVNFHLKSGNIPFSITATSVGQSQLQPLFPILEALPDELHVAVPFVLSFIMGK